MNARSFRSNLVWVGLVAWRCTGRRVSPETASGHSVRSGGRTTRPTALAAVGARCRRLGGRCGLTCASREMGCRSKPCCHEIGERYRGAQRGPGKAKAELFDLDSLQLFSTGLLQSWGKPRRKGEHASVRKIDRDAAARGVVCSGDGARLTSHILTQPLDRGVDKRVRWIGHGMLPR